MRTTMRLWAAALAALATSACATNDRDTEGSGGAGGAPEAREVEVARPVAVDARALARLGVIQSRHVVRVGSPDPKDDAAVPRPAEPVKAGAATPAHGSDAA